MKVLLHRQKKELMKLLEELSELHKRFRSQKNGFESLLLRFIEEGLNMSEQSNKIILKNKIESLKTDYILVNSGIDPRISSTIKQNRRKTIQEVSHHIIKELEMLLINEYEQLEDLILRTEDSIGQIILSAVQSNQLKAVDLLSDLDLQNTSVLINQLNKQSNIKLINQKLLLKLNPIDLEIIYHEVIRKICQINQFELSD